MFRKFTLEAHGLRFPAFLLRKSTLNILSKSLLQNVGIETDRSNNCLKLPSGQIIPMRLKKGVTPVQIQASAHSVANMMAIREADDL